MEYNFDQVHNYYERLVFEEVARRAHEPAHHLGILLRVVGTHADAVGVDIEAVVAQQEAFCFAVLHRTLDDLGRHHAVTAMLACPDAG